MSADLIVNEWAMRATEYARQHVTPKYGPDDEPTPYERGLIQQVAAHYRDGYLAACELFEARLRDADTARQQLQAQVNEHRCPDCSWVESGGCIPCVRHGGCMHGITPDFVGPDHQHLASWDDTWEHWRKRALFAEKKLQVAETAHQQAVQELDEIWKAVGGVSKERNPQLPLLVLDSVQQRIKAVQERDTLLQELTELHNTCGYLEAQVKERDSLIASLRELVEQHAVSTRVIVLDHAGAPCASAGPRRLGHNPSWIKAAELASRLPPETK